MEQPETMSTQTCPNCGGRLWESASFQNLQYCCEFAHCFTSSALVHEQGIKTSNLVWAALWAINEKQTLSKRLASNAMEQGWEERAEEYNLAASVGQIQSEKVRLVLGAPDTVGTEISLLARRDNIS